MVGNRAVCGGFRVALEICPHRALRWPYERLNTEQALSRYLSRRGHCEHQRFRQWMDVDGWRRLDEWVVSDDCNVGSISPCSCNGCNTHLPGVKVGWDV